MPSKIKPPKGNQSKSKSAKSSAPSPVAASRKAAAATKQPARIRKSEPVQKTPLVRNTKGNVSAKAQNLRETSSPIRGNQSAGDASKTLAINMAAANEIQKQKEAFEKATKLFNSRKFDEALKLFEAVAAGPSIEFAHVARLHVKMCGQRLQKSAVPLDTPDDRYNFAISLINQRANLDEAERHLKAAVQAKDTADHFHYALALCLGLNGDFTGSSYHLGRAIALVPNNRSIARNDPDFKEILQTPQLREVMSVRVPTHSCNPPRASRRATPRTSKCR